MKNPNKKIIDLGLAPNVNLLTNDLLGQLLSKVQSNPVAVPEQFKGIVTLVNRSLSFTLGEKKAVIYSIVSGSLNPERVSQLQDILLDEMSKMSKFVDEYENSQL